MAAHTGAGGFGDLDPAIQKLGIDSHPNHPYQDPRVTRYENDGRAFLRGTDKQYDLIIFALPDSLTLVSSTAHQPTGSPLRYATRPLVVPDSGSPQSVC